MHEKLQDGSAYVEAQHELLVDDSKDEICRIKYESQDECYLDVEEMRKEVDKDFLRM